MRKLNYSDNVKRDAVDGSVDHLITFVIVQVWNEMKT